MADVLRISNVDYTDTSEDIDLLGGRFKLVRGIFQPKIGKDPSVPVIEVIDLVAQGTVSQILTAEEDIHDRLERAAEFLSRPTARDSWWLEWHTNSEPGAGTYAAKRAMIRGGQLQLNQPKQMTGAFVESAVFAQLALERAPFWENVVSITRSQSSVSALGGQWNISSYASDMGTKPGRISLAKLSAFGVNPITTIWLGIRELDQGISNFESLWELEDGSGNVDTTSQPDGAASGGYKMYCTFSTTTTLASRVTIQINDVAGTADYDDFVGRYLVLCRCRVGSTGTVCNLELRHGMEDTQAYARSERVPIDNTGWMLIELGEIQIPPDRFAFDMTFGTALEYFTIDIQAERISGTGDLNLDCLVLIPSGHILTMDQIDAPTGPEVHVYTLEDETMIPRLIQSSAVQASIELGARGWQMPRDPGIVVMAAQRASSHVLTDSGTIALTYYPRWRLYRNAT